MKATKNKSKDEIDIANENYKNALSKRDKFEAQHPLISDINEYFKSRTY